MTITGSSIACLYTLYNVCGFMCVISGYVNLCINLSACELYRESHNKLLNNQTVFNLLKAECIFPVRFTIYPINKIFPKYEKKVKIT